MSRKKTHTVGVPSDVKTLFMKAEEDIRNSSRALRTYLDAHLERKKNETFKNKNGFCARLFSRLNESGFLVMLFASPEWNLRRPEDTVLVPYTAKDLFKYPHLPIDCDVFLKFIGQAKKFVFDKNSVCVLMYCMANGFNDCSYSLELYNVPLFDREVFDLSERNFVTASRKCDIIESVIFWPPEDWTLQKSSSAFSSPTHDVAPTKSI